MTTREIEKRTDALLNAVKLKRTGPRRVVLAALLRAAEPQSAEQIAAKLGTSAPNKVTVYRTLETFVNAGVIHKAFLQRRSWHFEPADKCTDTQCHPHFTCTHCGDTHCLTEISIPMANSPHKGFIIRHQQVRLEGMCPDCA